MPLLFLSNNIHNNYVTFSTWLYVIVKAEKPMLQAGEPYCSIVYPSPSSRNYLLQLLYPF